MVTTLYRLIAKLPNYVRAFGILHGLRLLLSMELRISENRENCKLYQVPGYPCGIHLRQTISDHAIFWQCLVLRQYDISIFPQSEKIRARYRELVAEGARPVIVDCGGNIGLSALYLAHQFPEAVVVVVEPDEENFEVLRKNTSGLGSRVVSLLGGVWHHGGRLRIVNPESGSAAFRVESVGLDSLEGVDAYTIDDICRRVDAEAPLIAKIDVEGAQMQLFSENTDWVQRTSLIMLELDDWRLPWQGTSQSFFSCVSSYPFDYLLSGETIFCFRHLEEKSGARYDFDRTG